jgi:hypothetical protein
MSETRSVRIDLPPRAFRRLAALKERTEAASYAEVVRAALVALEGQLDRIMPGDIPDTGQVTGK